MTEKQIRFSELLFTIFVLNLFERTQNPVLAFAWLKSSCQILHLDPEPMQRLCLQIMARKIPIHRISDELSYLLFTTNQNLRGIIKLAARSRAQIYRRINVYKDQGYTPIPLTFSEADAQYAAEFLKAFDRIGGILP